MSSWANRSIPRKRDISQIPEELRPTLLPRFQHPQVVLSESFQPVYGINEFNSSSSYDMMDPINSIVYPVLPARQYPVKKIEYAAVTAKELRHNDKSYVFVILRHIRNTRDNDLWITSYNSIRKFYTNKIVIIDDNSSINTVNGKLVNADVIDSEYNGAGEILPYYYFLQHKWADRMIFLHDSMFMNRHFTPNELDSPIRFHWEFSNKEAKDTRKIITYLSLLKNNTELLEYESNETWKGCFGATSIIDLEIVESIEEKYSLFSALVLSIRSRKDRESFERVFGIVMFFENLVEQNCSNFGLITKYPGAFQSEITTLERAQSVLHQAHYDTAIIKVWRGR